MSDDDDGVGSCLGGLFFLYLGLQILAILIATVVVVFVGSLVIGLFISIFVGLVSAIKNSVVGINHSVSNIYMKVALFIVIGLVVLAIIAPVAYEIYRLVLMYI